jgi:hypothetical protein
MSEGLPATYLARHGESAWACRASTRDSPIYRLTLYVRTAMLGKMPAPVQYPKLFDVVALLQSLPPEALHLTDERYDLSIGLEVGAVGTVVEAYPRDVAPSACLIEFSDAHGRGYALATVPVGVLLVLHYVSSEAITAQS